MSYLDDELWARGKGCAIVETVGGCSPISSAASTSAWLLAVREGAHEALTLSAEYRSRAGRRTASARIGRLPFLWRSTASSPLARTLDELLIYTHRARDHGAAGRHVLKSLKPAFACV